MHVKIRKTPTRITKIANRQKDPIKLLQEREPGELEALARLARLRFESKFEQVGPYKYRLRTKREQRRLEQEFHLV